MNVLCHSPCHSYALICLYSLSHLYTNTRLYTHTHLYPDTRVYTSSFLFAHRHTRQPCITLFSLHWARPALLSYTFIPNKYTHILQSLHLRVSQI